MNRSSVVTKSRDMYSSSPGYNTYTLQGTVFLIKYRKHTLVLFVSYLRKNIKTFQDTAGKARWRHQYTQAASLKYSHAPSHLNSLQLYCHLWDEYPRCCSKASNITYKSGGKATGHISRVLFKTWSRKCGSWVPYPLWCCPNSCPSIKHPVITIIQEVYKSMHIQTR